MKEEFDSTIVLTYGKKLVSELNDEFVKSSKPIVSSPKLHRGRSHSVSSLAEDLFAKFLADSIPEIEKIYIDQPMTYQLDGKSHKFIPDITVVIDGEIVSFFDIKVDMGYNRTIEKYIELSRGHSENLNQVKGSKVKINTSMYKLNSAAKMNYKPTYIKVSEKCTYSVVILARNNGGKNIDNNISKVSNKYKDVEYFIVCNSNKYHPREIGIYKKTLLDKLDINYDDLLGICFKVLEAANKQKAADLIIAGVSLKYNEKERNQN